MRKPMSKVQMTFIIVLWAVLCFLVITRNEHLDGPVITSLVIATALVFIPIWKSARRDK